MARTLIKIEVFWDDQDSTSEGWVYRLHFSDGHEEDNPMEGDADDGIETLRDELPCGDLPDDVWPETLHWTPMQGAKGWTAEVSR
mgnify:CR=1 FL=1